MTSGLRVERAAFPPFRNTPVGPTAAGPPPSPVGPDTPAVAACRELNRTAGPRLRTRVAGVFLFLPRLARLGFDQIVSHAGSPGSPLVPAPRALLSLLTLKVLAKERRSQISDFNFDEALGLCAGLNVLPKATSAADSSSRTPHSPQQQLRSGGISGLAPLLWPQGKVFWWDFPALPVRGAPTALDNHLLPCRGKAGPSLLSFFA